MVQSFNAALYAIPNFQSSEISFAAAFRHVTIRYGKQIGHFLPVGYMRNKPSIIPPVLQTHPRLLSERF